MSFAAQLVIGLVLVVLGFGGGVKYHAGVDAQRELAAKALQESDRIQQRKFGDQAAGQHAGKLVKLSNQLGDAREQIASLSGRECLAADTVGVLNRIDGDGAAAGKPSGAAGATAGAGDERYATDKDVARFIAACRAQYGAVSDQVNKILDIEDSRHPPATSTVQTPARPPPE